MSADLKVIMPAPEARVVKELLKLFVFIAAARLEVGMLFDAVCSFSLNERVARGACFAPDDSALLLPTITKGPYKKTSFDAFSLNCVLAIHNGQSVVLNHLAASP